MFVEVQVFQSFRLKSFLSIIIIKFSTRLRSSPGSCRINPATLSLMIKILLLGIVMESSAGKALLFTAGTRSQESCDDENERV